MYFLYTTEIYIGRSMKLKGKINKNVYLLSRVAMSIKESIAHTNTYPPRLVIKARENKKKRQMQVRIHSSEKKEI